MPLVHSYTVKMVKEKEKSEKVKYDAATTVRCPKCNEDVQVGTAGPAGIIQHQGKKSCQKARQAKKDKGKLWTLFQLYYGDSLDKVGQIAKSGNSSPAATDRDSEKWLRAGKKANSRAEKSRQTDGQEVPIATESDKILAFKLARAEAECTGVTMMKSGRL
ncbi:hypothetical protein B0H34DRAFT_677940 [Crassisporium funariophilum]|nr:hypothetical protein B0H34DRAFT_677940 [Crassisporium funariophilum]